MSLLRPLVLGSLLCAGALAGTLDPLTPAVLGPELGGYPIVTASDGAHALVVQNGGKLYPPGTLQVVALTREGAPSPARRIGIDEDARLLTLASIGEGRALLAWLTESAGVAAVVLEADGHAGPILRGEVAFAPIQVVISPVGLLAIGEVEGQTVVTLLHVGSDSLVPGGLVEFPANLLFATAIGTSREFVLAFRLGSTVSVWRIGPDEAIAPIATGSVFGKGRFVLLAGSASIWLAANSARGLDLVRISPGVAELGPFPSAKGCGRMESSSDGRFLFACEGAIAAFDPRTELLESIPSDQPPHAVKGFVTFDGGPDLAVISRGIGVGSRDVLTVLEPSGLRTLSPLVLGVPSQHRASVAALGGGFAAVWVEDSIAGRRVVFGRFDGGGSVTFTRTLADDEEISSDLAWAWGPAEALVAWHDGDAVRATLISPQGYPLSPPLTLTEEPLLWLPYGGEELSVVWTGSTFVAGWSEGNRIELVSVSSRGDILGRGEIRPSAEGREAVSPRLVASDSGIVLVHRENDSSGCSPFPPCFPVVELFLTELGSGLETVKSSRLRSFGDDAVYSMDLATASHGGTIAVAASQPLGTKLLEIDASSLEVASERYVQRPGGQAAVAWNGSSWVVATHVHGGVFVQEVEAHGNVRERRGVPVPPELLFLPRPAASLASPGDGRTWMVVRSIADGALRLHEIFFHEMERLPDPPPPPSTVTGRRTPDGRLELTWPAVEGAHYYVVRIAGGGIISTNDTHVIRDYSRRASTATVLISSANAGGWGEWREFEIRLPRERPVSR